MKAKWFLVAAAVVVAGSMMAKKAPTVSPDMARNELNGGKVKQIVYLNMDDYDVANDTVFFTEDGSEQRHTAYLPTQLERDDQGRMTYMKGFDLWDEGEGEEKSQSPFEETYYYVGDEHRIDLIANRSSYMFVSRKQIGHMVYKGQNNAPSQLFTYVMEQGDYILSLDEMVYVEADSLNNWTRKEEISYFMSLEEGDEALKTYLPLFDEKTSAAVRRKLEKKLAAEMKRMYDTQRGNVEMYTTIRTRKIVY